MLEKGFGMKTIEKKTSDFILKKWIQLKLCEAQKMVE